MRMSETIDQLSTALSEFHGKVGGIVFNKTVSYGQTKFKYANISAIMEVIRKPLSSVGLSVIHGFCDGNLHTTLTHSSGQYITSVMGLGISPTEDHKKVGAAITYLSRYMLVSLLSLAADEDDGEDPETNVPITTKPSKTEKIECINFQQVSDIEDALGNDADRISNLLRHHNIESLTKFPLKEFGPLMAKYKKASK